MGVDLALALNAVGDKLSGVGLYALSAALLEEGVAVSPEPFELPWPNPNRFHWSTPSTAVPYVPAALLEGAAVRAILVRAAVPRGVRQQCRLRRGERPPKADAHPIPRDRSDPLGAVDCGMA